MSLRMPRGLSAGLAPDTPDTALHAELLAEQAANLGRLGHAVEAALAALAETDRGTDVRAQRLAEASEVVWQYFIQREVTGLRDHRGAISEYGIPREVLARLGRRA